MSYICSNVPGFDPATQVLPTRILLAQRPWKSEFIPYFQALPWPDPQASWACDWQITVSRIFSACCKQWHSLHCATAEVVGVQVNWLVEKWALGWRYFLLFWSTHGLSLMPQACNGWRKSFWTKTLTITHKKQEHQNNIHQQHLRAHLHLEVCTCAKCPLPSWGLQKLEPFHTWLTDFFNVFHLEVCTYMVHILGIHTMFYGYL
jgi:hypothetical protein